MHDRDHGPGIFPLGKQTFPHTLDPKICVSEKKNLFDHGLGPKSIGDHLPSRQKKGHIPGRVCGRKFFQKNTQNMSQDP